MIDLLVMTDGRPTIFETIPSAEAYLSGPISGRYIHDDSGDPDHAAKLERVFPEWTVWQTPGRQGFGGAIRSAWSRLLDVDEFDPPYVFHLEDDFTFRRPIELIEMIQVLMHRPNLVQLALRRQPWNAAEIAAGGIVEQHPADWTDHALDPPGRRPRIEWLESRRNFTTNPCLYRRSLLVEHPWPEGPESEGRYSIGLLEEDPSLAFGYFGGRDSGEAVHHIGATRAGTGY